jgi:hypothetical protein
MREDNDGTNCGRRCGHPGHALLDGYFRRAAKSANNAPTTQTMTMIAMLISSASKCGILIDYVGMLTLS